MKKRVDRTYEICFVKILHWTVIWVSVEVADDNVKK